MVFKHNTLSFDRDDTISCHVAFHHKRQLDFGSQFPFSAHRHIPEKQTFVDGVRPGGNLKFESMTDVASIVNDGIAFDNNVETVRSDNDKRPIGFEENLQAAAKRTRQMDGNFLLLSGTSEESFTSTADEEYKSRKEAAVPERSDDSCGNGSGFPWYSCSTSEDRRLSFFPGYYEDHCSAARYCCVEESPSHAFNYIFRKPVAIGSDHQADIPLWRPKSSQNCQRGNGPDASTSFGHILTDENNRKIDCHCFDEGSIRCVRQHVMEAREQLRSSIGHEQFLELGLGEMGEDVALGWTGDEEELFNEVVASNPASVGKNFWDYLPRAFPSRSSKELVSYYFNVFMLRKRAEQNRSDPSNVDSDDDEWQQETEEDDDNEDDSGVESPTDCAEVNTREDEDDRGEECDEEEDCEADGYKLADSKSKCDIGDVHDDSCTSHEDCTVVHDVLNHGNLLHAEFRNDGISGTSDHDFFVGDCDLKPWDASYIGRLDTELELLPTSVIEDAFRSESWEKS